METTELEEQFAAGFEAAEEEPDECGHLGEQMDRMGKVARVYADSKACGRLVRLRRQGRTCRAGRFR